MRGSMENREGVRGSLLDLCGICEGGDDQAIVMGDVRTIMEARTGDGGRGRQCHR